MAYSLANINVKNNKNGAWRLIRISDDTPLVEQHGQLFCIAELLQTDDKRIDILEDIINNIFSLFTKQDTFTTTRSEDLLEHLLEETNNTFTEVTKDSTPGYFSDLSLMIGIIKNESMVLSNHGNLQAWILHPFAKKDDESSYKWVNILENSKKGNSNVSGKLFDQVVAGELIEKQSFIISTKNIWQLFTQDEFKDLICDNRVNLIRKVITKTVSELQGKVDLAMILGKDESTTQKNVLSDKGLITDIPDQLSSEDGSEMEEKHKSIAKIFGRDHRQSANNANKTGAYQPKPSKIELPIAGMSSHIESKISHGKNWFFRLSKKSKIIFVIATILIVVFIQSLSYINFQNQDEKISVQFDEQLTEIQTRKDEADAKLIYNDKESARKLIEEALALTYNLPQRYKKEVDQKNELTETLTLTLQEIDGLETLSVLTNVITFPNELPLTRVHEIIPLRSGVMLVATEEPYLYVVDVSNKTINKLPLTSLEGTISDTAFDTETKTLYALTEANEIYEILLATIKISDESIATKKLNFSIADIGDPSLITYYGNKIYAVDSADQQIKKLTLQSGDVTDWLSSKQEGLGATLDLGIDGNLYMVMQDKLIQYFKGEKTAWGISGVTPEPHTLVSFHTSLNNTYLYLLDNTTKRLIILNKDGSLFKQLTASELTNPSNITVNESGKELYILDNRSIYRSVIDWL